VRSRVNSSGESESLVAKTEEEVNAGLVAPKVPFISRVSSRKREAVLWPLVVLWWMLLVGEVVVWSTMPDSSGGGECLGECVEVEGGVVVGEVRSM